MNGKYNLPGALSRNKPPPPAIHAVLPTTLFAVPPAGQTAPQQPVLLNNRQPSQNHDETLLLDIINHERIKAGLPIFTLDRRLAELARLKSHDMYQNNYFSHISPTYGSALEMEKKAGISARVMGAENIAKAATVQRAQELFMGSASHRANILNPQHDAIGIGFVELHGGVVVTQLFLGH